MTVTLSDLRDFAHVYVWPFALKLVIALLIFVIGRAVSRVILRALDGVMDRSKLDVSLRKFLGSIAYTGLLAAVVIASLDAVGVKTTAVVAVLGAAGLAIGLALQGSLSNFAAGVMLIVLRPYKVGDQVTIGKYVGKVDSIKIFHTVLITADQREVSIPNGQIIAQPIENLTVLGRRRLDLVVSVAQGTDLARARAVLAEAVTGDERVHRTPAPAIEIAEITDAAIRLAVRPWTSAEHHTQLASDAMERIKVAMDAAGMKVAVALQPPA